MITDRSCGCHNSRVLEEMVRVPDGNPWRRDKGRDPLLQAEQEGGKHGPCVNRKPEEQKSVDRDKIKGIAYRRNYFICLTSYTSTVLAPVTEMRMHHHLPKV